MMIKNQLYILLGVCGVLILGELSGCKQNDNPNPIMTSTDTTTLGNGPIDWSKLGDTYAAIADPSFVYQWGIHNVHDPSIIDDGTFFYCYNTDVAYGHDIRPGIQIRRSINLVEWEFVGWVFNGLPTKGSDFIKSKGGTPFNSLWAPYIMKVGNEFRVYYSLSSPTPRLSCIGLATSTSPHKNFVEKDLVVTSLADNSVQTNAIDPTVLVDKSGKHWMYYGSAWDGIYVLELDPETGLAKTPGDKGKRVAQRGFTNGTINGNIEGPEIIYNEKYDHYYLFIAYDWLETKYNVRVGRSENPEGPFYDINGTDLNEVNDNIPMIIAPYKFNLHSGWQGTSHVAVFQRDGNYYIAHQGRPGIDRFYMDLHVRQLHWTKDGWPMASAERFAAEEETPVSKDELTGSWEEIVLNYKVVPGFADTQVSPDFQRSTTITIDAAGTVNGDASNTWTYDAPWLTMNWQSGRVDKLFVERGRDWENKVDSTVLFTGMDQNYTTVWGKKIK